MAPVIAATVAQGAPLALHEALSGVFGSISLAAWIFLLVPQVLENYTLQSADGISLAFLTVWFIGDITNLLGALWAGLVPTVIALAVYFCFADLILIVQCLYYNYLNARKARRKLARTAAMVAPSPSGNHLSGRHAAEGSNGHASGLVDAEVNEQQPLLARRDSSNLGLPGSHRRKSSATSRRRRASSVPSLAPVADIEDEHMREWVKNTLSIVGVCLVGAVGWVIAWKTGVWTPPPPPTSTPEAGGHVESPLGAQILGYASAVCYLGARIPQIIKNQRDRSCEGLSLLFFMLSLLGNATYGAGVSKKISWEKKKEKSRFADENIADFVPLAREGVLHDESALVDWVAGHYGRGCGHLRSVPHVRRWCADGCCRVELVTAPAVRTTKQRARAVVPVQSTLSFSCRRLTGLYCRLSTFSSLSFLFAARFGALRELYLYVCMSVWAGSTGVCMLSSVYPGMVWKNPSTGPCRDFPYPKSM